MKTSNSTTSLSAKTTVLVPPPLVKTPRLYYLPMIWNQIQYIIEASPKEVGWWGLVEKMEDDYIVTALYVPQQEVTGTETDISADTMAALAMEIIKSDKDPSKLYYWGHSHVNMGVSPSGQDETQVREYLETCPVFIRGIYNKRGESKVDIYDVEQNVCFESVVNKPLHPQLTEENKKSLDKLLATNVKAAAVTTYVSPTYYNGYQSRHTGNQYTREHETRTVTPVKTPTADEIKQNRDNEPELGNFFLVGEGVHDFYHDLDVDELATLHAHIYN